MLQIYHRRARGGLSLLCQTRWPTSPPAPAGHRPNKLFSRGAGVEERPRVSCGEKIHTTCSSIKRPERREAMYHPPRRCQVGVGRDFFRAAMTDRTPCGSAVDAQSTTPTEPPLRRLLVLLLHILQKGFVKRAITGSAARHRPPWRQASKEPA